MKEIILGLMSQAYKSDEQTLGSITELLENGKNDDVLNILLEKDKQRITSIQEENRTTFKDAHKKATSEVLKDFETKLKAKYNIESDKLGIDLVEDIISKHRGEQKEFTDNDFLKHPSYSELIKKHSLEKEELKREFENFKKDIKNKEVFDIVSSKLLGLRETGGFVVPSSENIANRLQINILRDLKDYTFDVQEGGNIIISQNGEVLKDGHGNRVDFADFANNLLNSYYVTQKNNGGGNSGSGKGDETGKKDVITFATPEDLKAYLNNMEISTEERSKVLKANEHLIN